MTDVGIFIDWQNAYQQARQAFGLRKERQARGVFSPLGLARLLAARRGRGQQARLTTIEIHRGLADPRRDGIGNQAALRHRDAWLDESGLIVPKLRPLAYHPETGKPEEKGIDVALGIAALEYVLTTESGVAIIFSHDTDLLPVVEAICRLSDASRIETASWWSRSFWKRIPTVEGVVNHALDEEQFKLIETAINYRKGL